MLLLRGPCPLCTLPYFLMHTWGGHLVSIFLVGISVTSIASGRLGVCLVGNRRGKSHSGPFLLVDPMGI